MSIFVIGFGCCTARMLWVSGNLNRKTKLTIMNATKKAIRLKQIPLSWSRKLSNLEFTNLSNIMYESTIKILGNNSALDQFLPQLRDANSELQALRPATTSHYNTALINEWHKVRKKRLSYIIVASRDLSKLVLHPEKHHNHYVFLHNWIEHYGKRLYDLGIDKLTAVMTIMEYDYDTNDEFREAIDLCFKRYYDDMIELTHKIVKAQISRSVDLFNSNPGRGYISVRKDVVCEWQFFISLIVDRIWQGKDVETMTLLYNTLSHFITEHRAVVKSRETKRINKAKEGNTLHKSQNSETNDVPQGDVVAESSTILPTAQPVSINQVSNEPLPEFDNEIASSLRTAPPTGGMKTEREMGDTRVALLDSVPKEEVAAAPSDNIRILVMRWNGKRWY